MRDHQLSPFFKRGTFVIVGLQHFELEVAYWEEGNHPQELDEGNPSGGAPFSPPLVRGKRHPRTQLRSGGALRPPPQVVGWRWHQKAGSTKDSRRFGISCSGGRAAFGRARAEQTLGSPLAWGVSVLGRVRSCCSTTIGAATAVNRTATGTFKRCMSNSWISPERRTPYVSG